MSETGRAKKHLATPAAPHARVARPPPNCETRIQRQRRRQKSRHRKQQGITTRAPKILHELHFKKKFREKDRDGDGRLISEAKGAETADTDRYARGKRKGGKGRETAHGKHVVRKRRSGHPSIRGAPGERA